MNTSYVQTFGSFVRNSKYPLEADYIFRSEDELRQWEQSNNKYLHEGLFKVVVSEDKQTLYWCYKGTLVPVLDSDSLENIIYLLKDFELHGTLRAFIRDLQNSCDSKLKSLQQELDNTQAGVGLNGDGTFDQLNMKDTTYLDGATSVTSALKALDREISGLVVDAFIEDAYYDSNRESIVIIFNTKQNKEKVIEINVSNLIREWEPDNTHPSKVVELIREETYSGGPDKLSADVRILQDKNNILEKKGNSLVVYGTSENITHEGQELKAVLDNLLSAPLSGQYCIFSAITSGQVTINIRGLPSFHVEGQFDLILRDSTLDELEIYGIITEVLRCPIQITEWFPWMNNVKVWHNTVFDMNGLLSYGSGSDNPSLTNWTKTEFGSYNITVKPSYKGCTFLNVYRYMEISSPETPYMVFDLTKDKSVWGTPSFIYNTNGKICSHDNIAWIHHLNEVYNTYGRGIQAPWMNAQYDSFGNVDIDFSSVPSDIIEFPEHTVDPAILQYHGISRLGWMNVRKCENIGRAKSTLTRALLVGLNCSVDFSAAHLEAPSILWIAKQAAVVTGQNKTITLSGFNYMNIAPSTLKIFTDKGWTVGVNWDNDRAFKMIYDMNNSMLLAGNNTSVNYTARVTTLEESDVQTLHAPNEMYYTENVDDLENRQFSEILITSNPEAYKLVDLNYKEEYLDNEAKQREFNNITK